MSIFGEKKASRELEEDLFQLRKRIDALESQAKIAKLEAAEVYDKTLRLMQRMAKRYEVDMKDSPGPTPATIDGAEAQELDPISKSIMMRRGRHPVMTK